MTYSEKLKDPRWQKKRLKILERDEFSCQQCHCDEDTLNVHHVLYRQDADPWDYDESELITLCKYCHEEESKKFKKSCDDFLYTIKTKFKLSSNIDELNRAFEKLKISHIYDVFIFVLSRQVLDQSNVDNAIRKYFDSIKKESKKRENGKSTKRERLHGDS